MHAFAPFFLLFEEGERKGEEEEEERRRKKRERSTLMILNFFLLPPSFETNQTLSTTQHGISILKPNQSHRQFDALCISVKMRTEFQASTAGEACVDWV